MKLIPETRNNNQNLRTKIRSILKDAQHIHFIGFAYNKLNLDILGFPFTSNKKRHLSLSGTVHQMSETDIKRAEESTKVYKITQANNKQAVNLEPHNLTAYEYFRNVANASF